MESALNDVHCSTGEVWMQMAPLLDDALSRLGERDRNAIVLRFFENKSLREVGVAMGASESAAKMRVNRGLEKLRKIFSKRGVTLTGALIGSAIAANAVQAAPVGLTPIVTAAASGSGISAITLTLIKSTMKTMTWLKLKFAVSMCVGAMVAGGLATVALSAASANTNKNTTQTDTFLIVPGESVGKVRKGMTTNEVETVLGKPERWQGKMMVYDNTLGMTVAQTTKGVAVVFCGSSMLKYPGVKKFKGRTKEGIGMFSTRESVIKAFGPPSSSQIVNGNQEELKYKALGLQITLEEGKVFNILVDFRVPTAKFE